MLALGLQQFHDPGAFVGRGDDGDAAPGSTTMMPAAAAPSRSAAAAVMSARAAAGSVTVSARCAVIADSTSTTWAWVSGMSSIMA
ncbi:hypothetical protein I1A62_06810 (plasmid) [Rhodococcus sp. USK10]|uniref:hypothetical protein n=1 Tax=Rhodococcus sp. USK10 TaxID=2789739 RepID=UPI001C5FE269|nr:hypothetical protein [Rhodococcus sp. USK10]QYB00645.1 hypothetical protein I1A62_06810 [Rhodococcus sp. USK10]